MFFFSSVSTAEKATILQAVTADGLKRHLQPFMNRKDIVLGKLRKDEGVKSELLKELTKIDADIEKVK